MRKKVKLQKSILDSNSESKTRTRGGTNRGIQEREQTFKFMMGFQL
jgi:hypothetical protein